MEKGFAKRDDKDVCFYDTEKHYVTYFCVEDFSRLWPDLRKKTPLGRFVPVEFHSTPDSFTIKIVSKEQIMIELRYEITARDGTETATIAKFGCEHDRDLCLDALADEHPDIELGTEE